MSEATDYPLCVADDATFWPWFSWAKFAAWPARDRTVVVVPIAGMADYGGDTPLDLEETTLLTLLRDAAQALAPAPWLLVLPPLRFVLGPSDRCAFAVDAPTAHGLLAETVRSVKASGFRRILLLNASPLNEELCLAAGRDLHVEEGLDLFTLHLSALGVRFDDGVPPRTGPDVVARLARLLRELQGWAAPPPAGGGFGASGGARA